MHFIIEKLIPLTITVGLILILLSPMPFGSVEIWSVSFFEIITFLTFGVWLTGEVFKGRINFLPSPLFLPMGLFFALILLQTVELPSSILGLISPKKEYMFQSLHNAMEHIFGNDIKLSSSISIYPYVTKAKLLLYLSYAAFFLMTSNFIRTSKQIKRFFWIIFTIAIAEALIGLLQYLASGTKVPASGTYINPNHFAGLLLVIIPMLLGYIVYQGANRKTITTRWVDKIKIQLTTQLVLVFATSLIAISLILAQSRGAIFSFAASILIFYMLTSQNNRSISLKYHLGLFLIVIILYSVWIGLDPVIEKFSDTTEELPKRTYIWKDSLNLIGDFPLVGIGLGNFNLAYTLYKKEAYWPYVYDHAHNDYIELAAETGLLGFALVMWGIISFFKDTIVNLRNFSPKKDPLRYYLFIGCLSGLSGMMIHAVTEFSFQIPSNAYYFIFILGLSTSLAYHLNKGNRKTMDGS